MKKTKKGFTLVELVIVVAVMAVLVAVAIPTVSAITNTAQQNVAATNAQTVESMIKLATAEKAKTGDGYATLTGAEIETALENAKLGIENCTFSYDPDLGACKPGTAASGDYQITYAADGTLTVSPQS